MNLFFTYSYPILFSLIFGYYNGWQWTDEQDGVLDPKKAKKHWKRASVVLRFLAFAFPVAVYYFPDIIVINHFYLAVAISLPLFDMSINLTRGVHLFYLGTTSKTDLLGKWKWFIYLGFIIITAIFL